MKYINIGKLVNTHALKGEVRILSNFEYKSRIFKSGFILYIGNEKVSEVIETYRHHKMFDMVKFKGIDSINDAIKYKGMNVFINSEDLSLNEEEILTSDFPLYSVYNNEELIGKISEYRSDNGNNMIRVNNKYIPYNKNFIVKIDKENKIIYMKDIGVFL